MIIFAKFRIMEKENWVILAIEWDIAKLVNSLAVKQFSNALLDILTKRLKKKTTQI